MKISDFKNNIYSQFGEDGIIEKIFNIIKPEFNTCIEFGAWDGIHLSNCANLIKNKKWNGVLIESDESRYLDLKKNYKESTCINEFVDNKSNSLYNILDKYKLSKNVDLLSIDIDGNDYYILESLLIRPKLIIIEYNPTIPYWIDVYQTIDNNFGSSPLALKRLAEHKGYKLISATDVNMFFIEEKYFNLFDDFETNLSEIICKDHYNFIYTGYTGNFIKQNKFVFGLSKIEEKGIIIK